MPHDVDIVVLSDVPKDLGPEIEVQVGAPTTNPWSLPFAHRSLFVERSEDHDLFIYSEDDTLVTEAHVAAFLEVTAALPEDEIPGFLRVEYTPDGTPSYCSIHSHFHWDPASVRVRGGEVFAVFTNPHAAMYMLTRSQLQRCIGSGGFDVPPHEGRFDMLVSAATDPYTQSGLERVVDVSRLDEFVVDHLPNVYLDRYGITRVELEAQIGALHEIAAGERTSQRLADPSTGLVSTRWDQRFHAPPAPALRAALSPVPGRVLSVGCTDGQLEGSLIASGADVVAVPFDAVIGAVAATRGVDVRSPDLDASLRSLQRERFECIVLSGVLARLSDPVAALDRMRALLDPEAGRVVVEVPNFAAWSERRRYAHDPASATDPAPRLRRTDARTLRRWFDAADLDLAEVRYDGAGRAARIARRAPAFVARHLGETMVAVACPRRT